VALNYAARNRQIIARRLLEQITPLGNHTCKIDIYHNFMEHTDSCDSLQLLEEMAKDGPFPKTIPSKTPGSCETISGWIHRKGATPTTQSNILVIPGSRGSLSYLVEVESDAAHGSLFSLAHGAGRRMARSKALKLHHSQNPNVKSLLQTELGSVVVCEKNELVYEEAPGSYKDVDSVVQCLSQDVCLPDGRGLVRVLATLRPLLTYKYKNPYPHK
jgi:release factor H-coupled RctB family protein